MDLDVLRWFRSVADGATVTETAARAHLTQPALSRALGRLEREIGTPLLTRSGRTLRLTPAGRRYAAHVATLLDGYDAGLRAVSDLVDPEHGVVHLGFLHTFGTWLVPPLIRDFRAAHPAVRFDLVQHGEAGLLDELLSGRLDLVLTSGDPGHPGVRWRRLLTERLVLVVPAGHPLAGRRRVRLREVADSPFILLRRGYGLRATTEELCGRAGFVPRVAFEGDEVETLRGLVAAGLGVALLPAAEAGGGAVQVAVGDRGCSREVGVMDLGDPGLSQAAAGFAGHVLRSSSG